MVNLTDNAGDATDLKDEQIIQDATQPDAPSATPTTPAPPTYSPQPDTNPSSPLSPSSSAFNALPPPSIPPTNFLLIDRERNSVSGQYIIDTSLPPHPSSAPELSDNAVITGQHGGINVEVWVTRTERELEKDTSKGDHIEPEGNLKAKLQFGSLRGNVTAKVYMVSPLSVGTSITLKSQYGSVDLTLPYSFHGPLTCSTKRGSIKMSPSLQSRARVVREQGGEMYFHIQPPTTSLPDSVADLKDPIASASSIPESEAMLETTHGSMKVSLEGDGEDVFSAKGGVFSKLARTFSS